MKTIKISRFLTRIATWQPRPFIGNSGGGPVSGWFYRHLGKNAFKRNYIGQKWVDFWLDLSDFFA